MQVILSSVIIIDCNASSVGHVLISEIFNSISRSVREHDSNHCNSNAGIGNTQMTWLTSRAPCTCSNSSLLGASQLNQGPKPPGKLEIAVVWPGNGGNQPSSLGLSTLNAGEHRNYWSFRKHCSDSNTTGSVNKLRKQLCGCRKLCKHKHCVFLFFSMKWSFELIYVLKSNCINTIFTQSTFPRPVFS